MEIFTDKRSSNYPDSVLRRLALGVERLQDVVSEGEGDDGVARGHDDQEGGPEVEEGEEGPEGVFDVGVVSPRLGYHGAQLRVAESSDEAEQPRQEPDQTGESHRAGVLEHSLRADEDPAADDDADDDAGPVHQGQLPLEFCLLRLVLRLNWQHRDVLADRRAHTWTTHGDSPLESQLLEAV